MSILNDPKLEALLDKLHVESAGQEAETSAYFARRIQEGTLSWDGMDAETTSHFRDKMVALEKDKAEFCYALCRAMGARRIVECGTSYGVSTLYLAAAIRDNLASSSEAIGEGKTLASSSEAIGESKTLASSSEAIGESKTLASSSEAVGENKTGEVIATEWEAEKARAARRNFMAAGLAQYIDLREGDLAETLKNIGGPVDFVLLDIWTEAKPPALRHIAPHLHTGSVIIADNTTQSRRGYEKYFAYIADPKNGLRTMTLPFEGGLEMTVKV